MGMAEVKWRARSLASRVPVNRPIGPVGFSASDPSRIELPVVDLETAFGDRQVATRWAVPAFGTLDVDARRRAVGERGIRARQAVLRHGVGLRPPFTDSRRRPHARLCIDSPPI